MHPNLAIALAIPFGVIGVFLDQLRRTLNAAWVHMADKHAETANMAGIMRCAFLYPALLGLVLRFPVVFAANYFGQDVVESFLKLMPHWLTHSFEIMGGILPALGFAITIMVIGKRACCRGLSAGSSRCYTSRSTSWRWPSSAPVSPS